MEKTLFQSGTNMAHVQFIQIYMLEWENGNIF